MTSTALATILDLGIVRRLCPVPNKMMMALTFDFSSLDS